MATLTATPAASGDYVNLVLSGGVDGLYEIARTDSSGTWTVRSGDPATYSGGWVGQDFEAPLNEAVTYAARQATAPYTVTTSSPVTLSAAVNLPWLTHPRDPSKNRQVLPADFILGTRTSRGVALHILGKTFPISQSIRRTGYSGELILRIAGQAELNGINGLLDDGSPLLLRSPSSWVGYGTRWLQIDEARVERLTRAAEDGRFLVTLAFTECAAPYGAVTAAAAGFQWTDYETEYADWDALMAANATWLDVLAGV